MSMLKKLVFPIITVVLIALAWLLYQLNFHPSIDNYSSQFLDKSKQEMRFGDLRVTFVGVATLLFEDGEHAIMTDGFFTRPSLLELRNVAPNRKIIKESLDRLGVNRLDAVIPVHSHYDHALDSPIVADQTGALLVGSPSTANIGRGYELPEDRIKVVENYETLNFGKFKVTMIESAHSPDAAFPGEILSPLTYPAKAADYKMGKCYSILIEHNGKRMLVQGSAGVVPQALKGYQADVVFLGVGALGKNKASHRQLYWNEIVKTVQAKRLVLIHWDDFFEPLGDTVPLFPPFFDNFDTTMDFLNDKAKKDNVDVRIPILWAKTDPFEGLQ